MTDRRFPRLVALLVVIAAALTAPAAASAATLTMTQLPGAKFPNQLYLLSSDRPIEAAANAIRVTENGQPVHDLKVQASGTTGSSAFGAVILIDASDSMSGKGMAQALAAARRFVGVRAPSQPDGIVFFGAKTSVAAPMTTDTATLTRALAAPPSLQTGTDIYDAASTALGMLHQSGVASGLIVLLSDGRNTGSHQSEAALASAAAAAGVRVYSIGIQDRWFDGTTLQSLASATHGVYEPSTSPGLVSLFTQLGAEPANNYTISYLSPIPAGHAVQVSVTVPGAGTATAGYTASTASLPAAKPAPPVAVPQSAAGSFMRSNVAAIVVGVLGALLIACAVLLAIGRRDGIVRLVGGYVSQSHPKSRTESQRSIVERALGDKSARKIVKSPFWVRLRVELEVAEINLGVETLILIALAATGLVGWLLVTETGSPIAAPLAVIVPFVMNAGVKMAATRKRRMFSDQLPDNLQLIASAMRAGTTFVGALQTVVDDAPEPSRRELRRAVTDESLGVPIHEALQQVTTRMKSEDFQHVAVVAALQRETGGNTAEVIDLVADTIRERIEIRRMVRGLTAQGRLAGLVLSGLPVGLLLIISLVNPQYTHPLFHTTIGLVAMAIGVVLSGTGSFVIRRIVDIKI